MSRWDISPSPLVIALREHLDSTGTSYRAAGDVVGVSQTTIMNWAKGTVSITINADTQYGLAQLLGITPRQVLELAGLDLGGGDVGSGATGGSLGLVA